LVNHEEAEIDVSVERTRRGQGKGALIVGLGTKILLQEKSLRGFHAFVRPENLGSLKIFEKAGFVKIDKENLKGYEAIHYFRTGSRE
jgi:RimJ/RimL family protein N-acetyltransferase